MTTADAGSERGVALLAAVLLALVLSALGTALTVSGQTESSMVRNHQRSAEARAAAEAGLSHAVQLAVRNLNAFFTNGFATPNAAITRLLRGPDNAIDATPSDPANADNGSFETLELAGETELPRFPTLLAAPGGVGATYQARMIDEDDPGRNLTAADVTRIGENNQALADANRRAVIQVTGFAFDNTVVTLEGILARDVAPAIVTDQTITVSGNPELIGSDGGIHSNANLVNTGNPDIDGSYTATGTYTNSGSPDVAGEVGGGRPLIPITPVQASDHRGRADFVMTTGGGGGRLYGPFSNPATGALWPLICNASVNNAQCQASHGWVYDPGNARWIVPGVGLTNGTYYVQGNAVISGNPGTLPLPKQFTLVAEGYIEVSGNPHFVPDMAYAAGACGASPCNPLMFVTNRDLKLNGNMNMVNGIEASILVREQMEISGNPVLLCHIYVDNASSISNLVLNTSISGNPNITCNGGLTGPGFTVTGWREVR